MNIFNLIDFNYNDKSVLLFAWIESSLISLAVLFLIGLVVTLFKNRDFTKSKFKFSFCLFVVDFFFDVCPKIIITILLTSYWLYFCTIDFKGYCLLLTLFVIFTIMVFLKFL